ncbi:AmmeMemoRadiSam system radical SAM enzyme [Methanolobus sediminis]|uniref:AmmeMemoRadiSam system radical SAM enzyme n=1 Tax=Methanolobus sediminis TaxID=3072978 RepID=A0AA51ULX5_9EURY|nr:AmmeMemoRadiSam system radical SAM enzyme [Methanolobus sediminis]WMW24736.1 AmmeMemoRadiSam system radical SAM enzyme [Methanolobus sediminis]
MIKEAMLYEKLDDGKVRCKLCAHRCRISPGKRGFCAVRENRDGTLYTLNYNVVSSEALDPIEKKPLYHFYPGTMVYSLGTIGCNFRCKHCQNWTISQISIDEANAIEISPETAVRRAVASGARSIAWTYNEPTIWFEYTYDCAKLAKEEGLGTVYVTNGYITPEALETIAPYLDAFRVDIKAFTEDFYRDIASAKLAPVLESAKLARELGMHVEVVNLIIPTLNDSESEIREMSKWIYENLGGDTPVHFTRFHPYYKLQNIHSTPLEALEMAYSIAREEGIKYVYVGNVSGNEHEHTFCPECGELLIKRGMFGVESYGLTDRRTCPRCGSPISVVSDA